MTPLTGKVRGRKDEKGLGWDPVMTDGDMTSGRSYSLE